VSANVAVTCPPYWPLPEGNSVNGTLAAATSVFPGTKTRAAMVRPVVKITPMIRMVAMGLGYQGRFRFAGNRPLQGE
jgi:hypothetical protein